MNLLNDPIFFLQNKVKQQPMLGQQQASASVIMVSREMQCPQCILSKTKFSQTEACHFCGVAFCKECATKDHKKFRAFTDGQSKGRICRICDAKHILRHNYMPQKLELVKLTSKLAAAQKQYETELEMLATRTSQLDSLQSELQREQAKLTVMMRAGDPVSS